jgi:hypothetical protein
MAASGSKSAPEAGAPDDGSAKVSRVPLPEGMDEGTFTEATDIVVDGNDSFESPAAELVQALYRLFEAKRIGR